MGDMWMWRWRINGIKLARCKKNRRDVERRIEFNIMLDIKIANYYLSFQSP